MNYGTIDTASIFNSMKWDFRNWGNSAEIWVYAENVMEIRDLVCDWFDALGNDSANDRQFDPLGIPISQERADWYVKELDVEFDHEFETRGDLLKLNASAEMFARLTPESRLAFGQQIEATLKGDDQIKAETKRRQDSGEILPPPLLDIPPNVVTDDDSYQE